MTALLQARYRWHLPPPAPSDDLGRIPGVLRQVLRARGFTRYEAAKAYLEAHPPSGTENPFRMKGVEAAVERIAHALKRGETIVVYGDYDVDGVTATALLLETLQALGGRAKPYIPNRFDEGYGLNKEALERLHSEGARLVISVDCGIRALEEAEQARRLGLDLIITDHHHPGPELPKATAVVNPKQPGDPYPEKQLTGVGVAYKLAQALIQRLAPQRQELLRRGLDLVALGTIADVAPLTGENRHLVRLGLHALRHPTRQGLFSLIQVSGLKPERLSAIDVAFMLAPRLNAAGRLDTAYTALELLLTDDLWEAGRLAQQLDVHNRRRQQLTERIVSQAEALAVEDPENPPWLLFAAHEDFHSGVIGLAAARLLERYYRPVVLVQKGEEWSRGSCRSVPEFHITRALEKCSHLLAQYGGHSVAAGFTIRTRDLPRLRACLEAQAREALAALEDLRPRLDIDAQITLNEVNLRLMELLRWLEPTGTGNPPATFLFRGVRVRSVQPVGRDGNHLRLKIEDATGLREAMAFRQGAWHASLPRELDLVGHVVADAYNGQYRVQIHVLDWRAAD